MSNASPVQSLSVVDEKQGHTGLRNRDRKSPTKSACVIAQGDSCYRDSLDHLHALEQEVRLILARALLQSNSAEGSRHYVETLLEDGELRSVCAVEQRLQNVLEQRKRREEQSKLHGVDLRFVTLCERYQLDATARRILQILLLLQLSHAIKSAWGSQFETARVEAGNLLSLLSNDLRSQVRYRAYLSLDSALVKNQLLKLESGLGWNFGDWDVEIAQWIVPYATGDDHRYDSSSPCIAEQHPTTPLAQVVLPAALKKKVVQYVENYAATAVRRKELGLIDDYGNGLAMLFHGPSGTGKTMLAHALACHLGRPLYNLDLGALERSNISFEDGIKALFRQARLGKGIAFIDECDDILKADDTDSRSMLIEMEKADCTIVMATNRPVQLDPAFDRRIALKVAFAIPDESQRLALWNTLIPDSVQLAADIDLAALAKRFVLNGGLIKNAVRVAVNDALNCATDLPPTISAAQLRDAAHEQARSLFDTDSLYRPNTPIASLPINGADQQRLCRLAEMYPRMQTSGRGLCCVISAADVDTAVACVDAVATECHLTVRKFRFDKLLEPTPQEGSLGFLSRDELPPLARAFSSVTGEDHALLIVDRSAHWKYIRALREAKTMSPVGEDFLQRVNGYRGLLFVVTDVPLDNHLPRQFSCSLKLGFPERTRQIARWRPYFPETRQRDEEIGALVDAHPLSLNEIDNIARQASTLSLLEDQGPLTRAQAESAILRVGARRKPLFLFGHAASPNQ